MTVPSTDNRRQYDGNGSTTNFAYPKGIFEDSDLTVYLVDDSTGDPDLQTLNTDYTVTNAGSANGGDVVFTTAPASGKTVIILREVNLTQNTKLRNQGAFTPVAIENEFDRRAMVDQQLRDAILRSLRVSQSDLGAEDDFTLPAKSDRLGKYLSFDDSGLPKASDPPSVGDAANITVTNASSLRAADVSDLSGNETAIMLGRNDPGDGGGGTLYWDASSTETDNGGTIFKPDSLGAADPGRWKRRLEGYVTPEMFGAVGDGSTDDEPAFDNMTPVAKTVGRIECDSSATYKVGQWLVENATRIVIKTNGCTFRVDDRYSSTSVGIGFRDNTFLAFDGIRCTSAGGYETGRSRVIVIARNDYLLQTGKARVEYDSQHLPVDNSASDLWQLNSSDRAIRYLENSNSWIVGAETKNADVGIAIVDCFNFACDWIGIESYMKGLFVDGGQHVKLHAGWVHTMTPTFEDHLRTTYDDWRKDRPGNNGVLTGSTDASNYPILHDFFMGDDWTVEDSGEHGFRFGGSGGDRRRWNIGRLRTFNTGSAGAKFLGSDTTYLREFSVGGLDAVDCKTDEQITLDSSGGATQFVYDSAAGTITISGINWPEYFGGDITSVTISGSSSNNGTFTISSRDSDTQITVAEALTDETDSTPSSVFTWTSDLKVSHALMAYNLRDGHIGPVQASPDNLTFSCENGIDYHDIANVSFGQFRIRVPRADGVSCRPNNGGTFNDITRVQWEGGSVIAAGGAAVALNHEQITITHFNMGKVQIEGCAEGVKVYNSDATPGTLGQNVEIIAHFQGNTTNFISDKTEVFVEFTGAADATKSTNANNGSTWKERGDNMYVLKAGTWTAVA